MNKKSFMIIIGVLLWVVGLSVWWPLIIRFSFLLRSDSKVTSTSEIISAFTKHDSVQISLGAIPIVLGTAILGSRILLKLCKRRHTTRDDTRYADVLYSEVKRKHKQGVGKVNIE
jgi:hypothetical protein